MSAAAIQLPRVGWICLIGILLLVTGPATPIRSSDVVDESKTAQDAKSTRVTDPTGKSVDHVANEILLLRESLGSAWRSDSISDSSPSGESTEREVVRTALVDQARAMVDESPSPRLQSDFGKRATLREAAHQLELTAHTLECQELYSQADEVRAVAQQLRQQAREAPIPTLRFNGKHFTPVRGNPAD